MDPFNERFGRSGRYFPGWSDGNVDPRAPGGGGGPGSFRSAMSLGSDIDRELTEGELHPFAPASRFGCVLGSAGTGGAPAKTELPIDQVVADLGYFEGRLSHMYLDTNGYVTVGVGKMLPDSGAAKALAFVVRATAKASTAQEIGADFKKVNEQVAGKLAATYKSSTKLDLPDGEIDRLLKEDVSKFEGLLKDNFSDYETYPVPARRALLDMAFNLGITGLLKFKKLKAAAEKGDWDKAAVACHRVGPSEERNEWTRDRFLEAAK